jgi:hypothetical protein
MGLDFVRLGTYRPNRVSPSPSYNLFLSRFLFALGGEPEGRNLVQPRNSGSRRRGRYDCTGAQLPKKYCIGFLYSFANWINSIRSIRRSPVSHFDRNECDIPRCSETSRWLRPISSLAFIKRRSTSSYIPWYGAVRAFRDFRVSASVRCFTT